MLVKLWMASPPITIAPGATIGQAAVEMARHHVRRLLVVDPKSARGHLQGIVSLLDVARAFPGDLNPLSVAAEQAPRIPVRDVMTSRVRTVTPTTSIPEAARILYEEKIGGLPVTRDGVPVGVLTESDVFRAIVEMSGIRRPGTTLTLRLHPGEKAMEVARLAESAGMEVESFFCMEVDGVRTMTLRTSGRISTDAVERLSADGRIVLDVQPSAVP